MLHETLPKRINYAIGHRIRAMKLDYGGCSMTKKLPKRKTSQKFDVGIAIRRQVVGDHYVDRMLAAADDLTWPLQELVTEYCWGTVWARPQLSRRDRSLLNLAMLTA